MPDIEPIAGELFRFHVASRGTPEQPHLVDLEPYRWNGQCSCEHFRFRLEPDLARGAAPCNALRCWHLKLVRETVLQEVLPLIKKTQPKPI